MTPQCSFSFSLASCGPANSVELNGGSRELWACSLLNCGWWVKSLFFIKLRVLYHPKSHTLFDSNGCLEDGQKGGGYDDDKVGDERR